MPAAKSAVDGPGHRARVGRASGPPSGPLRPRMITGGARGPDKTKWWVASLPVPSLSPPAPGGGAGRVKEKGIAAVAAGRGPPGPLGQPRAPSPARPSWRNAAGFLPAAFLAYLQSMICRSRMRELRKNRRKRGFFAVFGLKPSAASWYTGVPFGASVAPE